jgi:hypothetical protein
VFVVYGLVIGAAKTGLDPTFTLSEFKVAHSIGAEGEPIPGDPGIPEENVASNIKEFPVVLPIASELERVGPEPPGSSGFFQIYPEVGPLVGESPQ